MERNQRLLNRCALDEEDTIYVLELSYGKDSLACLGAIEKLGLPLHRIVHKEVWATQTIPADLPPMVEFKAKADEIIYQRYGIKVEHICATKNGGGVQSYEDGFYYVLPSGKFVGEYKGFPLNKGGWCKKLKYENPTLDLRRYILSREDASQGGGLHDIRISDAERELVYESSQNEREITGFATKWSQYCTGELKKFSSCPFTKDVKHIVSYLGIAADEPIRIKRHEGRKELMLPLVEIGWDEAYCGLWCKYNDLLSPIYTNATRGGCWFCHNQGVEQLRQLRKNYPDLWALLMKWDLDSPTTFKADGHTVHDYDARFQMEDDGIIDANETWFWRYLDQVQLRIEGI